MRAAGHIRSDRLVGLAVVVAAALLAMPLALHADPAAAPAAGAPMQPLTVPRPDRPDADARRAANRERLLDARIERLHAGLQLAPAQDKLWPPVAIAIRDLREARGRHFREQVDAVADPVDALQMQGDHMAKVGAAMARLATATKPLVATFTPDQKSRLPELVQRAPLRKVVGRALGSPVEAASAAAALPQGATATPAAPPAGTGAAPPKSDDDDE